MRRTRGFLGTHSMARCAGVAETADGWRGGRESGSEEAPGEMEGTKPP